MRIPIRIFGESNSGQLKNSKEIWSDPDIYNSGPIPPDASRSSSDSRPRRWLVCQTGVVAVRLVNQVKHICECWFLTSLADAILAPIVRTILYIHKLVDSICFGLAPIGLFQTSHSQAGQPGCLFLMGRFRFHFSWLLTSFLLISLSLVTWNPQYGLRVPNLVEGLLTKLYIERKIFG